MVHYLDNYDVVMVRFIQPNGEYSGSQYAYKMHASMKPAKGDIAIVNSPINGFTTVYIDDVISKNCFNASRATKWIVDKVDCRVYHEIQAQEELRKTELQNAAIMASRVNNIEQLALALPRGSKARKLLEQAIKAI